MGTRLRDIFITGLIFSIAFCYCMILTGVTTVILALPILFVMSLISGNDISVLFTYVPYKPLFFLEAVGVIAYMIWSFRHIDE
jgi:hypothetical protein